MQWTNHLINEHIVLLDLGSDSTELEKKIDQIRYKWDGVNCLYWAGDSHSWQRYSKKIPLSIDLNLTSIPSTSKRKLTISPKVSLTPGGCYAVVLLHGIPLHPSSPEVTAKHFSHSHLPRGIAEDKVIFFKVHNPEKGKKRAPSQPTSSLSLSTIPHPGISPSLTSPSNEIYLSVRTFYRSHSPHEYHMIIKPSTTVHEIRSFLSTEFSIPITQLIFSLNGTLLLDDLEKFVNCGLQSRNMIRLFPSFGLPSHSLAYPNYSLETSNLVSSYAPYISSVTPSQYEKNVPLTTAITIRFQSVSHIARSGQYHKLLEQKKSMSNNSLSPSSAQQQNKRSPSSESQSFSSHSDHQRYVARALFLPCFRDISSPLPIYLSSENDMTPTEVTLQCPDMETLLGEEEAKNCGSRCWLTDSDSYLTSSPNQENALSSSSPTPPPQSTHRSSFSSNQRFYLLELDSLEMIEKDWRTLRYQYSPWDTDSHHQPQQQQQQQERSPNRFYGGGDRYSWQRYTRYLPVMGSFVINLDQHILTFKPSLPLYPGTTYGILLANGVPSVPSSSISAATASESHDRYSIQEDLLFVFTTEGRPQELSQEERMKWNRHDIQLQRSVEEAKQRIERERGEKSGEEGCSLS